MIAASVTSLLRRMLPQRPTPVRGEGLSHFLERVEPVSRKFGFDRGTPIDRFYIERFLAEHRRDIRGRVLEIGAPSYTRRFGADDVQSEVLHAEPGNPEATLVGDLASGRGIPESLADCAILTQTLPFIYDCRAAVATIHRTLKPGGVVLATVPGISQISRYDMDRWGDYWRFTTRSAEQLFGEVFGAKSVDVASHGNVFAAAAFLYGLSAEELDDEQLSHRDDDYQLLITIRAVRENAAS